MDRQDDLTPDRLSVTLKVPWLYTAVGVVSLLIGGLLLFVEVTSGDIRLPPLIGGTLFVLAGLYLVCAGSTTVRVEGQTIITKGLCRKPRQIEVGRISRIEHSGPFARLTLFGSPTARPVHLDYQLNGFGALVAWLWAQRPDLWTKVREQQLFRRTPWLWILVGGAGVISIGGGLFLRLEALWTRFFFVGMGLLMALVILSEPVALILEGSGFTLKYLLRQKHVPYRDIAGVGLAAQDGFPAVHLELTNGKKMQLGGYRGMITLYLALLERLLAERDEGEAI